ncbi:hypothetical protein HNR00_001897 [Methylorubrum rhodinum]|uniref:Uncharacterized protein n=1 Tax=Methylorubrum rhodinum TaxID=29428 RepID=A0A840ZHY2_9HYPH|nr:hypothetical protein [Methylorubrum rhodinum]MBB5757186.1 hypothetical protein [Methylorubrum rhodinum]
MSDDALAYLVEAFGHVSEAEILSFLDGTALIAPPASDIDEAVPAATVPAISPEPARAA